MKNRKIKIIGGLAGPALLMASLIYGCGGGGGGTESNETFTPTNITTEKEAKGASSAVKTAMDIVSFGKESINTASIKESKGLLKALLSVIGDKDLSDITKKETESCTLEGSVTYVKTGDNSGYVQFDNCKESDCELLNGRISVYLEDNNNNNIPEKLVLTFHRGFDYKNSCENSELDVRGDFSLSLNGKLDNNDIYTAGRDLKIKAEMVFNGGDIYANDSGEESLAHFFNLRFYGNEVDPVDADIEYSVNGGISYKDSCTEETINAVFETIEIFKQYADAQCPYDGKLSINGQVIIEAYDNDNNPVSTNNIRITLGNSVIFDNDCTQLESLGVCP